MTRELVPSTFSVAITVPAKAVASSSSPPFFGSSVWYVRIEGYLVSEFSLAKSTVLTLNAIITSWIWRRGSGASRRRRSSLYANDLTQRVRDLDQVALRVHY